VISRPVSWPVLPHPNYFQRKSARRTLKIGMCAPVTGPAAESGGYAIKGASSRSTPSTRRGIVGQAGRTGHRQDEETTNPGICWRSPNWPNPISSGSGIDPVTRSSRDGADVSSSAIRSMIGGTDPECCPTIEEWQLSR